MRQLAEALQPYAESFAIENLLADSAATHEIASALGVPVEWLDDWLRVATGETTGP